MPTNTPAMVKRAPTKSGLWMKIPRTAPRMDRAAPPSVGCVLRKESMQPPYGTSGRVVVVVVLDDDGGGLLGWPWAPPGPDCPEAPAGPAGPGSPVAPFGPGSPLGPGGPAGPAGPAGPGCA